MEAVFLEPKLTMVISHCRLKVQKSVHSELVKTEVQSVHVKLGRQARFAVVQNQVKMSKTAS